MSLFFNESIDVRCSLWRLLISEMNSLNVKSTKSSPIIYIDTHINRFNLVKTRLTFSFKKLYFIASLFFKLGNCCL